MAIIACKRILLALLVLTTWVNLSNRMAGAQTSAPKVIILNSYHPGFTWSDEEVSGIVEQLQQHYPDIVPAIEYLDAKRFSGPQQLERMKNYLADKYRLQKNDLLITLDNPALELVLRYRRELFPAVPLVFGGVNDFTPARLEGQKRVTGVAEFDDIVGTLKLALSLYPQAREVFVVHDYTATGLATRREVEAVAAVFQGRVHLTYAPRATMDELLQQIRALPANALLLITAFASDSQGQTFSPMESTRLFTAGLKIPAFAIKEPRLGHGIVGGNLLGGKEQGRRVGDQAWRVLAGEDPAQIPVDLRSTAVPSFDYRQLTHFHIPLSALPAGSIVINRPLSFYDQHKSLVWGTISVVTALITAILVLCLNIMGRRQAEVALQESEARLRMAQEAAGAGSWDWNLLSGEMIWSPENYLLLGLIPDSGKPSVELWLQCLHPDDRESAAAALSQALKETDRVNFEYRISRGDTGPRWLNSKGRIYRDAAGTAVRVIGTNLDITERRRAEEELRLKEKLLDGASDSIFLHDLAGQFLYLNEAAYKSRGYEKEELMSLSLPALLTPELLEARPGRLQELQAQGEMIFEGAHRRKDGSLMPVEIHARRLDLDDRQLILSVARDITERKLAEKALRESAALYCSLFENMLNGLAYCQMLYEQDQPQDFIYLDVNKSFETLTGLKNVVGKKVSEVIPELRGSNPELLEAYGRVALTGTPEKFEIYVHSLKMWFAIAVYSPAEGYFVAVFDVITARKQAEEALRTAAHQWRTTFDAISDAVCLLDRDSRIIQSNQAMADLVGKPHAEITGHFYWEFMDETGAIKSGPRSSIWRGRRRQTLTLPRGHRWLRVMVDPILDETGEVTGAVQIVSDITTHKRSQDRIRDLNILLRAIQNIDEALLRAKSESELFQQICDLLIGVPYVLFTWIGLVKPESFEVKPVAWAGDGEDYVSVIRVTWDDSEYGQGPTGAAIRTGKPVVRKSIETDPQPNPWRAEGLKRGHKSSIALPLIHQDEVIGVLKVYAGKEDAFKTKEIEFLTQVAGDIAVGVKSLRLEQGLEQSVRQLRDMMRQTVESISAISEIRDPYTAGHQRRTTQLACAIARELGLDDQRIEGCRVTGFLHDIGKIGVPAEILSKPGKLSEHEMSIVQTHAQVGYDILKNIDFPWPVAQIVWQHHERINGSGYPAGLTGPETLLEAKILAVADVVEAMCSHRPYRPALGPVKAMEEISNNKGVLYDPEAVEACIKLFEKRAVNFD
ncbi:MAG: PAS domain S-box protein [Desulfobaccales bacterium]